MVFRSKILYNETVLVIRSKILYNHILTKTEIIVDKKKTKSKISNQSKPKPNLKINQNAHSYFTRKRGKKKSGKKNVTNQKKEEALT